MNSIINPINGEKYSIFSENGKNLLKTYIKNFSVGGSGINPFGIHEDTRKKLSSYFNPIVEDEVEPPLPPPSPSLPSHKKPVSPFQAAIMRREISPEDFDREYEIVKPTVVEYPGPIKSIKLPIPPEGEKPTSPRDVIEQREKNAKDRRAWKMRYNLLMERGKPYNEEQEKFLKWYIPRKESFDYISETVDKFNKKLKTSKMRETADDMFDKDLLGGGEVPDPRDIVYDLDNDSMKFLSDSDIDFLIEYL